LTAGGIGRDFVQQEIKGQSIVPEEFMSWYHTESGGNKMIDFIEKKF